MEKTNFTTQSFRQAGRHRQGKLITGFILDAGQKSTVSVIPSKVETVLYKTKSTKAFGCSQNRFFQLNDNQGVPGPGYYQDQSTTLTNFSKQDTSLSKKGYGNGFASNSFRNTFNIKYMNSGPGPGQYEHLIEKEKMKYSHMFQSQSREQLSKKPAIQPPVGRYNPKILGHKVNPCHSSFISMSHRAQYLKPNKNPGPNQYNIN